MENKIVFENKSVFNIKEKLASIKTPTWMQLYNLLRNLYIELKEKRNEKILNTSKFLMPVYITSIENFISNDKNLKFIIENFIWENEENKKIVEEIIKDIYYKDFFLEFDNFISVNKRYPFIHDNFIKEYMKMSNIKNSEELSLFLLSIFQKRLIKDSKTNVKMKREIGRIYKDNVELFDKFFLANLFYKNWKQVKEFEELWKKVKIFIDEVEEIVVGKMETWKYSKMSTSIVDKYSNYIRTLFPMISTIWLKTKTLTKKEMEEYIKLQYKRK